MSDRGVCRTAPATPGLLIILKFNYSLKSYDNLMLKVANWVVRRCSQIMSATREVGGVCQMLTLADNGGGGLGKF